MPRQAHAQPHAPHRRPSAAFAIKQHVAMSISALRAWAHVPIIGKNTVSQRCFALRQGNKREKP
jgi:hypothetical protein